MSQIPIFPENCKFAALAVQNVRTDIRSELTIRPGTIAVAKLPFPLENHWRLWLGAMQSSNLENCNLFLVSVATSGWSEGQLAVFGGDVDSELMDSLGGLFAFLRIVGAIEYTDAFMVRGMSRMVGRISGISRGPSVSISPADPCLGWFEVLTCKQRLSCLN